MVTFHRYPPPRTPAQYNAEQDYLEGFCNGFTPVGTFVSPYSFLIDSALDGGVTYYGACTGSQTIYGGFSAATHHNGGVDGANADAVIQAALNNLTAGRTWKEKVVLTGDFAVDATLTIPSYSIFELLGSLTWNGADGIGEEIIENSDKVGGNTQIDLINGIYNGGNLAGELFDFEKLTDFNVKNVHLTNIKQLGAHGLFWNCQKGVVSGNNVYGNNKGLGFNFYDGCKNIAVANNVFDLTYDSAISIGSSGGVLCSDIAVTGNTAKGFNAGNGMGISVFGLSKDITITGNTITDQHFDGINAITDVDTPDRIVISGNIVKDCLRDGIAVQSSNSSITGNVVSGCTSNGIDIMAGRVTATGNNLQHCDIGIYIYPDAAVSYNVLTGNICYSNNFGIVVGTGCVENTIIGNNVLGNVTSNLVNNGTTTMIDDNHGFLTYNTAESTGTGAEQTIAHGLVNMPCLVTVVPESTGTTISNIWADATNIYVTVTNGKDYLWGAKMGYV
jgi:parallel beta-helix repeat protein